MGNCSSPDVEEDSQADLKPPADRFCALPKCSTPPPVKANADGKSRQIFGKRDCSEALVLAKKPAFSGAQGASQANEREWSMSRTTSEARSKELSSMESETDELAVAFDGIKIDGSSHATPSTAESMVTSSVSAVHLVSVIHFELT